MELAGNEKRIQALFSELSREDARVAPRFEKLWRAASVAEQLPRRFSKSLVVVAATLMVAVTVLFVALSQRESSQDKWRDKAPIEKNAQNGGPQTSPSKPQALEPGNKRRTRSHSQRRRTLARRQQHERALERQAAMLANWRSPTQNFMTSPAGPLFTSLPQLNESVKDLQSFLPNDKESNR